MATEQEQVLELELKTRLKNRTIRFVQMLAVDISYDLIVSNLGLIFETGLRLCGDRLLEEIERVKVKVDRLQKGLCADCGGNKDVEDGYCAACIRVKFLAFSESAQPPSGNQ